MQKNGKQVSTEKRYNFLLSLLLFPWYNFLLSKRVEKKFEQDWQNSWYSLPQLLLHSVLSSYICWTFLHCAFSSKTVDIPSRSCELASSSSPLRMQTCRQWMRRKINWEDEIFEEKRTSMHRISQVWVTENKPKVNWEEEVIEKNKVWVEKAKKLTDTQRFKSTENTNMMCTNMI